MYYQYDYEKFNGRDFYNVIGSNYPKVLTYIQEFNDALRNVKGFDDLKV